MGNCACGQPLDDENCYHGDERRRNGNSAPYSSTQRDRDSRNRGANTSASQRGQRHGGQNKDHPGCASSFTAARQNNRECDQHGSMSASGSDKEVEINLVKNQKMMWNFAADGDSHRAGKKRKNRDGTPSTSPGSRGQERYGDNDYLNNSTTTLNADTSERSDFSESDLSILSGDGCFPIPAEMIRQRFQKEDPTKKKDKKKNSSKNFPAGRSDTVSRRKKEVDGDNAKNYRGNHGPGSRNAGSNGATNKSRLEEKTSTTTTPPPRAATTSSRIKITSTTTTPPPRAAATSSTSTRKPPSARKDNYVCMDETQTEQDSYSYSTSEDDESTLTSVTSEGGWMMDANEKILMGRKSLAIDYAKRTAR
ncbi:unnamed protein product [Amoebophrya sp. A25]|nr:unnamed protein product [Amoebophrya sp. A25]|eukprot:GSA25T00017111001.1